MMRSSGLGIREERRQLALPYLPWICFEVPVGLSG